MKIKNSSAGFDKKNDVLVELSYNEDKRNIVLTSPVIEMFEANILITVNDILDEYKLNNINVILKDNGALDFAIKARLRTAIIRGVE